MKLLSDVILTFLVLLVAVLFLTGNGLVSSAYSADVESSPRTIGPRHVVHDLDALSWRLVTGRTGVESLVLELGWQPQLTFATGDMRGTLFIDRSDSPFGCVVACQLDTSKLRASPRLTVQIPIARGDTGYGFQGANPMELKARFVERK